MVFIAQTSNSADGTITYTITVTGTLPNH